MKRLVSRKRFPRIMDTLVLISVNSIYIKTRHFHYLEFLAKKGRLALKWQWHTGQAGDGALPPSCFNPIQTGGEGGGAFGTPPPTPKELWLSNFLTFPKIYLETFWYNYHVHVINHVAMATSFWLTGFGKFKKWWFFCFKIAFLHL